MSERLVNLPYRRASKLFGMVRAPSTFCRQHQHGDLAGGLSYDEVLQAARQLAEAHRWVKQLGAGRAPNERAAEQLTTVDEEVF